MPIRFGFAWVFMTVIGCAGTNVDTGVCSSGRQWNGGGSDDGSALMNPGVDCIACHAGTEAPLYTVAGTVMGALNDPDDCFGVPGVTVTIIDADGVAHDLLTNESGNFFTTDAIPTPYTAMVDYNGVQVAMVSAQTDGACLTCHTELGANLAPGRIVAP